MTDHSGHRSRKRRQFRDHGIDAFADHEVLELMLFYAIPQRNVNPLAHRLLDRFGTLHAVLEAPVEELMKVEGVGQYAALLLNLILPCSILNSFLAADASVRFASIAAGFGVCGGVYAARAARCLSGRRTVHYCHSA